jgi:hypothetical protein
LGKGTTPLPIVYYVIIHAQLTKKTPFKILGGYSQQKKLGRTNLTLLNYILASLSKIKGSLIEIVLRNLEEILKQPLFCNIFPALDGSFIGNIFDDLCVFVKVGYSQIRDL